MAAWLVECGQGDPADDFKGYYSTLEEGFKLLAKRGVHSLSELARLHLTEIDGWMSAELGDVAIIHIGGDEAFGIVGRGGIHVLRDGGGLAKIPLDRAVGVFRSC